MSRRTLIFVGVFVVLAVLFHLQSNGLFLTPRNLSLMLRQSAILAVVAAGVAILMTMSEIDLSIGSAVFLCGVVSAELATQGNLPLIVVVLAALGTGVLLGAVQGAWVVFLGIPSFIATLAGLLAFRGIGLLWTNAATIGPVSPEFTALSESYIPPGISYVIIAIALAFGVGFIVIRDRRKSAKRRMEAREGILARPPVPMGRTIGEIALLVVPLGILAWIVGGFLGIPMALVWVVIIVIALSVLMLRTTYGRGAYLLGANREAAIYSGVNVKRTVFIGFIIMGALYGVAGVLLTARLGSSTPGAGEFLELDAIAAAVIGGVSLRGGVGKVAGAVMGAVLLTTINNGMSILNISSFSQAIIKGLILIAALGVDAYILRRSSR
ncbi:sugar ABC transporter permease [Cryobacterium tagatosivorans]|nr:sugar ABC transporter permease [Cryobacterium tagatosivorans]